MRCIMTSPLKQEQYETICMLEKAEKVSRKELLSYQQKYINSINGRADTKRKELALYFGTAYDQFQEYKSSLECKYRFKFPLECHTAGDDKLYYAGYFREKFINRENVTIC